MMGNVRKYILTLSMLLPMLVMMAHDIIPHHQWDSWHECTSKHSSKCCDDLHTNLNLEKGYLQSIKCKLIHDNNADSKQCCHFSHHRLQQELKFHFILSGDLIIFNTSQEKIKNKYVVLDDLLIIDPHICSPSLRAPPKYNS